MMNTRTPTVSVIVRTTLANRDTRGTLLSIQDQTFVDREVIIVDDEGAHTAGAAWNRGINGARGQYLAFLEAGDLWTIDFLERQLSFLDAHPWCDAVYCDANLCGDSPLAGRTFSDVSPSTGRPTLVALIEERCAIPLSTVVARREAVVDAEMFDESLEHRQDYDLWLRLAHRGRLIAYQRHVLAECWLTPRDRLAVLQGTLDALEHFGRSHVLAPEVRRTLRSRATALLDSLDVELARLCFLDGNFAAARFHLAAPRGRSPRLILARLALGAAPRVARWMFVAVRKPATWKLASVFR